MQVVDADGNVYGDDNLEINDVNGKPKTTGGGGGGAVWGTITGTLSAQTDLQTALNGKFNNPTGTTADYIDGTGGLQAFPTLTSADKMVTVGRNSTGSTLYAGTIIYILGSTGNRPNYVRAQANTEATSAGTFGVIQADIPNNSDGNAVIIGTLSNLDTRSVATHPFTTDTLVDGDTIYLSPTNAGYITRVKPSAPNHIVYIGKVVRTSPTNGTIVYRIQNGYELEELHNVAISSVANNDLIQYDSATLLWKNESLSSAGIQPTITPGALTKTDDTNVTLTLGGSPSTALLQATSLTLGWTGTLADSRIASASTWNSKQNAITTGTTAEYFRGDLSLATFPTIPTVGTWGALNYPSWSSGTPFVKMTAAGTFALDTNTYQGSLTLTTTGTSGASTLIGNTLNIPQYGGGGGGGTIYKLTSQTLTAASWVLASGYYTYTFSNVNITTNTRVDFTPDNASYIEVTTCGLTTQVTVAAGTCTFYSIFPPQNNITGEITIFPTV